MIRHTNQSSQQGFTIIELMLSLGFVAFLLIFVISATIEVMGDYNKGVTIKAINQSARSIIQDMSTVARSTTAGTANLSALGAGRACLGGVSYVWNIKGAATNKYTTGSTVTFARVADAAGALCVSGAGGYPAVNPAAATSLITAGQVWVQSVGVVLSTDQSLITLSINLSTAGSNQPTGSGPNGPVCVGGSIGNFCAVAAFSTTVNARNLGG
jgi:type II secretory pathway pseudopilin PulG